MAIFLVVRQTAELAREIALDAADAPLALDDVHGEPDRPGAILDTAIDGLADPPRGVRGELVPAAPVELLDGADQAEHALLDEIQERQVMRAAVLLRDGHDEPQVGRDHPLLGSRIATLDALRQLDLLAGGEQRVTADLLQEQIERVVGHAATGGSRRSGRRGCGSRLDLSNLDAMRLEERVQLVEIAAIELERLGELSNLFGPHEAVVRPADEECVELCSGNSLIGH